LEPKYESFERKAVENIKLPYPTTSMENLNNEDQHILSLYPRKDYDPNINNNP